MRCHRSNVAGVTKNADQRGRGSSLDNAASTAGRLVPDPCGRPDGDYRNLVARAMPYPNDRIMTGTIPRPSSDLCRVKPRAGRDLRFRVVSGCPCCPVSAIAAPAAAGESTPPARPVDPVQPRSRVAPAQDRVLVTRHGSPTCRLPALDDPAEEHVQRTQPHIPIIPQRRRTSTHPPRSAPVATVWNPTGSCDGRGRDHRASSRRLVRWRSRCSA